MRTYPLLCVKTYQLTRKYVCGGKLTYKTAYSDNWEEYNEYSKAKWKARLFGVWVSDSGCQLEGEL